MTVRVSAHSKNRILLRNHCGVKQIAIAFFHGLRCTLNRRDISRLYGTIDFVEYWAKSEHILWCILVYFFPRRFIIIVEGGIYCSSSRPNYSSNSCRFGGAKKQFLYWKKRRIWNRWMLLFILYSSRWFSWCRQRQDRDSRGWGGCVMTVC